MLNLLSDFKNAVIATLSVLLIISMITLGFYKYKINSLNSDLKEANNKIVSYELQFKTLADKYTDNLNESKKEVVKIEKVYVDRIKIAKQVTKDKECEYLQKRIREYIDENDTNTTN